MKKNVCFLPGRRAVVLCALFVLLFSLAVRAQVSTADILGTAFDPTGAILVSVKVTATNLSTGLARSVVSNESGNFLLTALPVGHYNMLAEASGFKSYKVTDVAIAEGDRLRVDLHMEVGQTTDSVDVVAQTPALQADSSSVGTLINSQAVQDLPLNGRNFIRLAQLSAGVNEDGDNALQSGNRPDDRRNSTAVSVAGQHGYNNNFMIDGLDDNERYIGSIVVKPAEDALAEFKLLTNAYSAELGRTAGGVMNLVTKSGTDSFHGSLFEFFRNQKMDAKNFFAGPGPTPAFKQNQFGGSLGGPIKRGTPSSLAITKVYGCARESRSRVPSDPSHAARQLRRPGDDLRSHHPSSISQQPDSDQRYGSCRGEGSQSLPSASDFWARK